MVRLFLKVFFIGAFWVFLLLGIGRVYGQAVPDAPRYDGAPFIDANNNPYNTLSRDKQWIRRGDAARLSRRCFQITEAENDQKGALWWPDKIDLTKNWRFDFVLFAGSEDAHGADGFGFVMQTDPDGYAAIGGKGAAMGFGHDTQNNEEPISPSIAIEFDTIGNARGNGDCQNGGGTHVYIDPQSGVDHTAIVVNGLVCDVDQIYNDGGGVYYSTFYSPDDADADTDPEITTDFYDTIVEGEDNIESDQICYQYTILWQYNSTNATQAPTDARQRISLYVDDTLRMTYGGSILRDMDSGMTLAEAQDAIMGFTGATGGYNNEQTVCFPSPIATAPIPANPNVLALNPHRHLVDVMAEELAANPGYDTLYLVEITEYDAANAAQILPHIDCDGTALSDTSTKTECNSNEDPTGKIKIIAGHGNGDPNTTGTHEFKYMVCDEPTGDACYGSCTESTLTVRVDCPTITPNIIVQDDDRCSSSNAARGSVQGFLGSAVTQDVLMGVAFDGASDGDASGTKQQNINNINWDWSRITGTANVQTKSGNKGIRIPPGETASFLFETGLTTFNSSNNLDFTFNYGPWETGDVDIEVRLYTGDGIATKTSLGSPSSGNATKTGISSASLLETVTYSVPIANVVSGLFVIEIIVGSSSKPAVLDNISLQLVDAAYQRDYSSEYTIRWYSDAAHTNLLHTGRVYSGIDAYTYDRNSTGLPIYMTAEHKLSSACLMIEDDTVIRNNSPSLFTVRIDQITELTNCSPPNGALRALPVAESGITLPPFMPSDYNFTWADADNPSVTIGTGYILRDRGVANYQVSVEQIASGCSALGSRAISSAAVQPTVSITETEQTGCRPSGSITAELTSTPATNIEFVWYNTNPPQTGASPVREEVPTFRAEVVDDDNDGVPDRIRRFYADDFTGLNAGSYSVVAVDTITNCESSPAGTQVTASGNVVDLDSTITHVSRCTAPFNGQISYRGRYGQAPAFTGATFGTSGYTFVYYTGGSVLSANRLTIAAPSSNPTGAYQNANNLSSAFQLPAGTYTVQVRHTASGCSKVDQFTIQDNRDDPPVVDLSEVTITGNASCKVTPGDATDDFDGSISFSARSTTTEGNFGFDDYSFATTVPSDNSTRGSARSANNARPGFPTPASPGSPALLNNLDSGDYVIRVTDRLNGCTTDVGLRVPFIYPVDVSLALTPNSACGGSSNNGSAQVSISEVRTSRKNAVTSLQLYNPSTNANIGSQQAIAVSGSAQQTGSHLFSSLADADYGLTLSYASCVKDTLFRIESARDAPILSSPYTSSTPGTTTIPNTHCTTALANGSATVGIVESGSDVSDPSSNGYSFVWRSGGPGGTVISGETDERITGRVAGNYTVTATKTASGCDKDTTLVINAGPTVDLDVDVEVADTLTACRESDADGKLRADVTLTGSSTAAYTYQWQKNGTTQSGATNREYDDLWEAIYTVVVTHTASGCTGTGTYDLSASPWTGNLVVSNIGDNSRCQTTYNGGFDFTIKRSRFPYADIDDYDVSESTIGSRAITSTEQSNSAITGLQGGTYVFQIKRKGCLLASQSVTIDDDLDSPTLAGTITPNSSCNPSTNPNGVITIVPDAATGSAITSNYSYAWSRMNGSTPVALSGETSNVLDEAGTFTYRVQVTKTASSCVTQADYTVAYDRYDLPTATPTLTHVSDCDPYNGSISVGLSSTMSGTSTTASDYDWSWFIGTTDATAASTDASLSVSDNVLSNAKPKTYAYRFTHPGSGCVSTLMTATLDLVNDFDTLLSNYVRAGTCSSGSDYGSYDVEIDGGNTNTYTISLYEGTLADYSIPVNTGSLTRVPVERSPSVVQTHANVDEGDPKRVQAPTGYYTLVVEEATTTCKKGWQYYIGYTREPAVVHVRNIVNSQNCKPYLDDEGAGGRGGASGSAEIELEVDISTGDDVNDFRVFVYQSATLYPVPRMTVGTRRWSWNESLPANRRDSSIQSLGTSNLQGNLSNRSVGTITSDKVTYEINGLSEGTYLVVAAREDAAACFSPTETFEVDNVHDNLVLTATVADNKVCKDAKDGEVAITTITRGSDSETTSATLRANYAFAWYEGTGIYRPTAGKVQQYNTTTSTWEDMTAISGATNETLASLSAGTYTAYVEKTTSGSGDDEGCYVDSTFVVNEDLPTYALLNWTHADITNCATPTGTFSSPAAGTNNINDDGTQRIFNNTTDFKLDIYNNSVNPVVKTTTNPPSTPANTQTVVSGLAAGNYGAVLVNTDSECAAPSQSFVIDDNRSYPTINPTATLTSQTNCSPANGGVAASATTPNTSPAPTYAWVLVGDPTANPVVPDVTLTNGTDPGNGSVPAGATTLSVSGLVADNYIVRVTDGVNQCQVERSFVVGDARAIPTLASPTVLSNRACTGGTADGAVIVQRAHLSPNNIAYTLSLQEETASPPSPTTLFFDLSGSTPPNEVAFTAVSNGTYRLSATANATQCRSALRSVTIDHEEAIPRFTNLDVLSDLGCTNSIASSGAGAVELTLATIPDRDNNGTKDFTYDFTIGSVSQTGITTEAVPSLGPLAVGPYTLTARNNEANCSFTESVQITRETPTFRVENFALAHQSQCAPLNGRGSLLELDFGRSTLTQTDRGTSVYTGFSFGWSREGTAITTPFGYRAEAIQAGRYVLTITHTASACSQTYPFEIQDQTTDPQISISEAQVDQSCNPSYPTGKIIALGDGKDYDDDENNDGTADYAFAWYEGSAPTGTVLNSSGHNILGEAAGDANAVGTRTYTVLVTRADNGCTNVRSHVMSHAPLTPSMVLVLSPTTDCAPLNGAIRVTNVMPGITANYDFHRFDQRPNPGATPDAIVNADPLTFTGLAPQQYFVRIQHKLTQCQSVLYGVQVQDDRALPVTRLDNSKPQTLCDPAKTNGELTAAVVGNPNVAEFQWTWLDANGTAIGTNSRVIADLDAGNYTLRVRKISGSNVGCESEAVYRVYDESISPLEVLVEQEPNINCASPYSGVLAASLREIREEKTISDYQFLWKRGTTAATSLSDADEDAATWTSLQEGNYTVIAYDKEDNTCRSNPLTIALEANTGFEVAVREVKALTHCEETNAEIEAYVPGDPDYQRNYIYRWFRGTSVRTSLSIGSLLEPPHTEAGAFTVEVERGATTCKEERAYTLEAKPDRPGPPILAVLAHNTSCTDPRNGIAVAITGTPAQSHLYQYEWVNKNTPQNVLYRGNNPKVLGAGIYQVYTVKRSSSCRSSHPAEVEIKDRVKEKNYDIEIIEPSLCSRATGSAEVVLRDAFEVVEQISLLEKSSNRLFTFDNFVLLNVPVGNYTARLTERSGCVHQKDLNMPAKFLVNNGLSPNGDGLNEFMLIDCIDRHAQNKVSVFTHDGQLVFSTDHYDNLNNVFDGHANKGSRSGRPLPEGTYFYVIEGIGTDPMSGFLEIVR